VAHQFQVFDKGASCLYAAAHAKADEPACTAAEVLACPLVAGMAGQAGIEYPGNLGMLL
jgi:hypothetical protein